MAYGSEVTLTAVAQWESNKRDNPFWVTSNQGFEYGSPTIDQAVAAAVDFTDKTVTMKVDEFTIGGKQDAQLLKDGYTLTSQDSAGRLIVEACGALSIGQETGSRLCPIPTPATIST